MYDRWNDYRMRENGGAVYRYHATEPSPGRLQTVAEHSFNVAMLLYAVIGTPSGALIKAALHHDLGEQFVGDTPAPVKWNWPDLAKELDLAEQAEMRLRGWECDLLPHELAWLRWADLTEAGQYALRQVEWGFRPYERVFNNVMGAMPGRLDALRQTRWAPEVVGRAETHVAYLNNHFKEIIRGR
jgi:hypothetical protein